MFKYFSHAHSFKPLIGVETPKTKFLTVFDPVDMSYNYGTATKLRARIQAKLDALPPA